MENRYLLIPEIEQDVPEQWRVHAYRLRGDIQRTIRDNSNGSDTSARALWHTYEARIFEQLSHPDLLSTALVALHSVRP